MTITQQKQNGTHCILDGVFTFMVVNGI